MSKRKIIEPGEEFQLGDRVFTYSVKEGGAIAITPVIINEFYDGKKVKIKKVFTPPTIDEVKTYFKEKGYSPEGAQKAFDYYVAGEWKDSGGKPVKNWKQKMLGVWMRPEYLLKPEQGTNNNFFNEEF